MVRSLVVVLLLWISDWWHVASASTALVGFDAAFTSATNAFAVTECDAACTSPATVSLVLKLVRSGDTSSTSTVSVSTRASSNLSKLSATAGNDYVPLTNEVVTFLAGETTKVVPVTIISDGVYEEDEYFEAAISSPSAGTSIVTSTATAFLVIKDGGDAGIFSFSASSYTFSEDAGIVEVDVVRTGGASGVVRAIYRLADTTTATAINTKSFHLLDSMYSLTFADGQRRASIRISVVNDTVYEANEFFFLQLSSLTPVKASDPSTSVAKMGATTTAVIFIADDGDAGRFDFADPFIFCREDNGSAVVSIVRSLGTSSSSYAPVVLVVATAGASGGSNASEGNSMAFDYTATSSRLSWADGETRKTFSFPVFNNKQYDPKTRAIKVRMQSVDGGARIGDLNEMWVNLIDDRDAGTLSFKQAVYQVSESAGSVTLEIVRTGVTDPSGTNTYTDGTIRVDVATYAGVLQPGPQRYALSFDYGVVAQLGCTHTSPCTAEQNVEYTPLATTSLVFTDGQSAQNVTIPILNNDLFQAPARVFKVLLQNVSGGAHLGLDYEHPPEWQFADRHDAFLALERRASEVLDNVGAIVRIEDDGDAAVLVSKASLSVSEIGQSDLVHIRLNAAPTAVVTIAIEYDATVLVVSTAQVEFSTSDWNVTQAIEVSARDNDLSQGLVASTIRLTISSTDPRYNAPVRTAISPSTGVAVALSIFSAHGDASAYAYDSGDPMYALPWDEASGVLTAPWADAAINVFVLDDDVAGLKITPESIRFETSRAEPGNHVAVRIDGHIAKLQIALTSEPADVVVVTLRPQANQDKCVVITPSSVTIAPSDWQRGASVEISAAVVPDYANATDVRVVAIDLFAASAGDAFYNAPDRRLDRVFVLRYPRAHVLLNTTEVLTTRENDPDHLATSYDVALASEPMYWEPSVDPDPAAAALLWEWKLAPTADTTLAYDLAVNGSGQGKAEVASPMGELATLLAASNASSSTATTACTRIGALRFTLYPDVLSLTGSASIGLARLRLYRLEGGINGGLGGVRVGVAVAAADLPDDWDEASLVANCSDASVNNGEHCSEWDRGARMTEALFPAGTTFANISMTSSVAADITIESSGAWDAQANVFVDTPGWIELDVTAAVNQFLAQAKTTSPSTSTAKPSLTLLIYAHSVGSFLYDGVDQVTFASKDHSDASLHPQLCVLPSGRVNLARATATATQSQPGNAPAAIDGIATSTSSLSASYAMANAIAQYPWWQADLAAVRLIEDVVVTIKRKASAAATRPAQLNVTLWCFFSESSLVDSTSDTATIFARARQNASFQHRFELTSRSFAAAERDTIVRRWHVFGESSGEFVEDAFRPNYTALVRARFVLLQVEGENSVALNEVEIFQPAMASTRVQLGGYMPSVASARKGQNQLAFAVSGAAQTESIPDPDPADSFCNVSTAVCRHELLFTSGDWHQPQTVHVRVVDDAVATGDRDVLLSHTLDALDPDYDCRRQPDERCATTLFEGPSGGIKMLQVLDDDEPVVLFSTSTLQLNEGSAVVPMAPHVQRPKRVMPVKVRCSDRAGLVRNVNTVGAVSVSTADNEDPACATAFVNQGQDGWRPCIANASAAVLAPGSAWMLATFETALNVTRIELTVPVMRSAAYVRRLSVWTHASHEIDVPLPSVLDAEPDEDDQDESDDGWTHIATLEIAVMSGREQVIALSHADLGAAPVKLLLVALEQSYDDVTHCVVAPHVAVTAMKDVPFPLATRGDLTDVNSVTPAESGRSRMHQVGTVDVLEIRLASEPIADVFVAAMLDTDDPTILAFDALNGSLAEESRRTLVGARYEDGSEVAFSVPTALRFTPENWVQPQRLTFLAADDNTYQGNRTIVLAHTATSDDNATAAIPIQRLVPETGRIERTFSTLDDAQSYVAAPFMVATAHDDTWPFAWRPTWTSAAGAVTLSVVDDDLPGVTLSQSQVEVSESADSANFSIVLDSAPTRDVVVTIAYRTDAKFLTLATHQVTFTRLDWRLPHFVELHPVPNDQFDAGSPLTLAYSRLVAKAKQPVLLLTVASQDPSYNALLTGGNEPDRTLKYVQQQGVTVLVLDDDTGCPREFACQNGGQCVNESTSATGMSTCACASTFGMHDCAATCATSTSCAFSRIELLVQCPVLVETSPTDALCRNGSLSRALFAMSLFRLLTTTEFTSASGKSYGALALGAQADALYVVNATQARCADASITCMRVIVDIARTSSATADEDPAIAKLTAYAETGSLQRAPFLVQALTVTPQYPPRTTVRIVVWVIITVCALCSLFAAGLGISRAVMSAMTNAQVVRPLLAPSDSPPQSPRPREGETSGARCRIASPRSPEAT